MATALSTLALTGFIISALAWTYRPNEVSPDAMLYVGWGMMGLAGVGGLIWWLVG